MLAIALRHVPHACCLVPEKREEKTTEGGLDVVRGEKPSAPLRRGAQECGHPRVAVHRAGRQGDRSGGAARRRKSWSCTPAPIASARSTTMPPGWRESSTGSRARRGLAAAAGPGSARRSRPHLQYRRRGRGACPRSSSSTSATSSSAKRSSADLALPSRACARSWTRPARRESAACRVRAVILGLGNDIIDIRRIEKTHRALRRSLPRPVSSPTRSARNRTAE